MVLGSYHYIRQMAAPCNGPLGEVCCRWHRVFSLICSRHYCITERAAAAAAAAAAVYGRMSRACGWTVVRNAVVTT